MSDLSSFLWQIGTEVLPVKGACSLCGTALRGLDENGVGVCILCRPLRYESVCKPCDPLAATPERAMSAIGVCVSCGDTAALYSVPRTK